MAQALVPFIEMMENERRPGGGTAWVLCSLATPVKRSHGRITEVAAKQIAQA
jgi:hypothetical protein